VAENVAVCHHDHRWILVVVAVSVVANTPTTWFHAQINKMTLPNLAIVFGPNILRPRHESMLRMIEDARFVNGVLKALLEEYEFLVTVCDRLGPRAKRASRYLDLLPHLHCDPLLQPSLEHNISSQRHQ
jgi:hypothetical protein